MICLIIIVTFFSFFGYLTKIYYLALSYRDLLLAEGRLEYNNPIDSETDPYIQIGTEFCGICGWQRVMGLGFPNRIDRLVWKVPEGWRMDDAATIPGVYAMVTFL